VRYAGPVTGKERRLKSIYRFQILSGKSIGAKFDICVTDTNNEKRGQKARAKLISVLQDFEIIEDPDKESVEWVIRKDAPIRKGVDHCILQYDSINGVIQ